MAEPDRVEPVSAAQQAMLVERELQPGHHDRWSGAFAWRFRRPGSVDPVGLGRAVARLAERHEVLRAGFRLAPEPVAVVRPLAEVPFRVLPVVAGGAGDSEPELAARLADEADHRFDLSAGPLFRCTLFDLGAGGCVVSLVVHHLACDGWSVGVLVDDLSSLYRTGPDPPGRAAGAGGAAGPAPRQLGELAARQRERAATGAFAGELAFWTGRLAGLEPVELPADHPRPAVPSGRGATVRRRIPPSLVARLAALAGAERATMFMVGLTAFQVLAGRYAGVADVPVGIPVAGRDRPESWQTVGLLADSVVIRTDLRGDPAFRAVVGTVRDSVLAAMEHAEVPFAQVVSALNPHRARGRNPLFQLMFAADRTVPLRLGRQIGTPLLLDRRISTLDVAVTLLRHQRAWYVQAQYDADLFDHATVRRLVDNYLELLGGAAAAPDRPVWRLPLVSAAERRMLLRWGGRPRRPDPRTTVSGLVERTVDRSPAGSAVVDGSGVLSYAELDGQANALAHRLRGMGVGRGDVVGIHLGRSRWLPVALLGVWKAGAGYLPLDPAYPARRLAFMAADAGARVLVTDSEPGFPLGPEVAVARLDPAAPPRPDRPAPLASGADLAYLIYTSGSTGTPKAVAVCHSAVVSAFHAWDELYRLPRQGARYPQVASFSFDNSVGEFVRPLGSGGTLHLCSREELRDPDAFVAYLERTRPYLMDVVPTVIRLARRSARYDSALPGLGLRHLVIGGEPWTHQEAESLRARLPGCRLFNVYGLTEATVDSTYHVVEPSDDGPSLPIGRPLPNTSVYVLDGWGQCVPAGVAGELCVAGPALAWGYLRRPGLTAERFVPDPYGRPGTRLYRTGDRCRFRADGELEFLGRTDTQVKLRGFRVELAEVEAALVRCPGVRRAVVRLVQQRAGEPVMVGYLAGDAGLDVAAVRERARQFLPGYMLPSTLVRLAELPLLPNGKVDRAALPEPLEPAPPPEAPADPLVRQVMAIWAEVLGAPVTDPEESFFGLGGTSLQAIQVVAEVRGRVGRLVPFTALFDHLTLGEFSAACRAAPAVTGEPDQPDQPGQPA